MIYCSLQYFPHRSKTYMGGRENDVLGGLQAAFGTYKMYRPSLEQLFSCYGGYNYVGGSPH